MIDNKEKNFVSLVVYVHDDERHVRGFLGSVGAELSANFDKYEVICVDDASGDGSKAAIAECASGCDGIISIINMSYQQGLEASMNAGVDLAIGDFIYEFDSMAMDYPVSLVMEAYRSALEGYDIVTAGPDRNRLTSRLYYWLYNRVSGTQHRLRTETFRILSRRAVNRIHAMNKTVPYRKAIYASCGLKMRALSYAPSEISKGGGYGKKQDRRMHTALNTLILFSDVAYKVSVCFALLMAAGAAGIGLYSLGIYLGQTKPVEGWTTTMLFLALCFCATFSLLAMIIKYLSIILDMIFRKQNYLVDSIEKFGK